MGAPMHTPAPWEWSEGRLFHGVPHSHSINVLVVHDPIWRPRSEDANLIKAAPELLEALEMLISNVDEDGLYADFDTVVFNAREAVRKARGVS